MLLRTLGGLEWEGETRRKRRAILAAPRQTEVLIYLLAATRAFHSRDRLATLFWPDQDAAAAGNALRQTLYRLRQRLGADAFECRGRTGIGANRAVVDSDAFRFGAAVAEGGAEAAWRLYRGPFLLGFEGGDPWFHDWVTAKRIALGRMAAQSAREAAETAEALDDLQGAVTWWERVLAISPHDERALRGLMRVLGRQGAVGLALEAYHAMSHRLARELDIRPSPATRRLAREMGERHSVRDGTTGPENRRRRTRDA